jgi:hypothetical protein
MLKFKVSGNLVLPSASLFRASRKKELNVPSKAKKDLSMLFQDLPAHLTEKYPLFRLKESPISPYFGPLGGNEELRIGSRDLS